MLDGDLMRVLIVEKKPNDRSALANVLAKRKDIEAFDSAENISEALDKLEKDEYGVVLLDSPFPKCRSSNSWSRATLRGDALETETWMRRNA